MESQSQKFHVPQVMVLKQPLSLTMATSFSWSSPFPTWHTVPITFRPTPFNAATTRPTFCCFWLLTTTWAASWARCRVMVKPILGAEVERM